MRELDNLLTCSLDKYFTTLRTMGYKDYVSVNNLLVLSAIVYILNNMNRFVTRDNLELFLSIVHDIDSTCLIDTFRYSEKDQTVFELFDNPQLRITESSALRNTEDSLFRAKA